MPKMEVTRIESCPCGFHGVKKFFIPETYENETLITCPKCNGVVYVELSKKEFDKRWIAITKTGNKEDIADFCRKNRIRGID